MCLQESSVKLTKDHVFLTSHRGFLFWNGCIRSNRAVSAQIRQSRNVGSVRNSPGWFFTWILLKFQIIIGVGWPVVHWILIMKYQKNLFKKAQRVRFFSS